MKIQLGKSSKPDYCCPKGRRQWCKTADILIYHMGLQIIIIIIIWKIQILGLIKKIVSNWHK